jgi:hypothetical protein
VIKATVYIWAIVVFAVALFAVVGFAGTAAFAAAPTPESVQRMTGEGLKGRLGNPDLIVIDVRTAHDWDESKIKIKGSVREEAMKIASWINKYPKDKTIVFSCK